MSSTFTRVLGIGFVTLSASALVMSCASSDTSSPAFGTGGSSNLDSGPDTSSGGTGTGGSGTGGTGTGGTGTGGTSTGGTGAGGSSTGGSGFGGSGTGGAATGGSGGGGTCNPAFCPTSGFGSPCCMTPNGPCGVDTGSGCQQGSTGNDF